MNTNRLGSKVSKEKNRPKSTENNKSLKGKSSDIADGSFGNVDFGNSDLENEPMVEQLEEYRINKDILHTVCAALKVQEKLKKSHQQNNLPSSQCSTSNVDILQPQPPKEKLRKQVIVRKLKSSSKLSPDTPKERVFVARPVIDDEEPDMAVGSSQFSVDLGEHPIKPHTILGSITDFKQQAAKERQYELQSAKSTIKSAARKSFQEENDGSSSANTRDTPHINELKALENWDRQMKNRQKQQKHLSKNLGVGEDMLVMNQSDDYRSVQEERAIIDRAMATKDYGKGYRVGSEFWRQVEGVGNNEEGISITLGEAEKGNVSPVEHIGNPSSIKRRMGTDWNETRRTSNVHKDWWKSSYLDERQKYFKDVIDEMDPHKPYIQGLEVVGHGLKLPSSCEQVIQDEIQDDTNEEKVVLDMVESEKIDPLAQFEDVYPAPIFGPSLLVNGHTAKWEGPPINGCKENGISIQLLFDCPVRDVATDFIDITNNGTATIKYEWKKQPEYDPFGLKKGKRLQRFYFDVCEGMILPGVTVKIPFIFKSPNAGIFMETWRLETNIALCGGRTIDICLHGIATKEDEYMNQRAEIEEMYRSRETITMMERIVSEMISSIKTPPRPSTPDEKYITEEDIFSRENANLEYRIDTLNKVKEFYSELIPDEDWDLSINTLLKNVVELDEEDKEKNLKKLNDVIKPLNHAVNKPVQKNAYDICYQVICEAIDKFVHNAMVLSEGYGMPEKIFVVKNDVATSKKSKKSVVSEVQKTNRVEPKSPKKDTPTNKKGGKADKGKAETPPVTNVKEPVVIETEEATPVLSNDKSHPCYGKYIEKMYVQVYNCLLEMAENLDRVLTSTSQV